MEQSSNIRSMKYQLKSFYGLEILRFSELTCFMTTAAMIRIKETKETTTIVGIAQWGRESFCSSFFRASTLAISGEYAMPEDVFD